MTTYPVKMEGKGMEGIVERLTQEVNKLRMLLWWRFGKCKISGFFGISDEVDVGVG